MQIFTSMNIDSLMPVRMRSDLIKIQIPES